jgi:hypothetical protein
MPAPSLRYWAFVSYSSKDEAVARRFHRALEHYRIPRTLAGRPGADGTPVPRRLFPVFRDRDELPLSADLGEAITGALRASRYLIVLCSPPAATSRWVNEEIRYFKSIGGENRILAIILAGRPNAADHGAAAGEECFPPALRYRVGANGELTDERCEPVGGDLRPGGDGWRKCLLKAVAGITGIGLADFTKREDIRCRRRHLLVAATALLAAAALYSWWDHARTKVGFHAFLTERFGAPEGVARVALVDALRGAAYYRVESSQGKVRRVVRMNGSGSPTAVADSPFREAIREYAYREDGSLQRVDLLAPDGLVLARQIYAEVAASPEGTLVDVEIKSGGQGRPLSIDARRNIPNERSEVSVLRYLYGPDGLPRQKANLDAHRSVVVDRTGSAGERRQHDGRGLVVEKTFLDAEMRPHPRQDGVQSIRYERDKEGRITGTTYHGVRGEPVSGPEGVHRIETIYDAAGNRVLEGYRDIDGQLAPRAEGYAVLRVVRDGRGNPVEEMYFGADRRPVSVLPGIAGERRKFDRRGNLTEIAFVGSGPGPVKTPFGYDTIKRSYDAANRKTREAYFADDLPVNSSEGFAALELSYDRRGHVVRVARFGPDGKPVVGRDGYAEMRVSYDEHGNQTAAAYFGVEGQPVRLPEGHSFENFAYDKYGNVAEISLLGPDGQPVPGAAVLRLERDERGNIITESSQDGEGRLVLERGYAVVRRKFDTLGNKVEEAYFGTDERPVLCAEGYASVKFVHDGQGQLVEVVYFGVDGRPVAPR